MRSSSISPIKQTNASRRTHAMSGVTLVELIVVTVITGILVGLLFGPLNSLYVSNSNSARAIIQSGDTRAALRNIERDITHSVSFLAANEVIDPTGTSWSWTGSGSTSRVLITSNYATTKDRNNDPANERVIMRGSDCSTPLFNNYIYFLQDGTLYRRTLKSTEPTCSTLTWEQKQTCTAGTTHPSCQGADAKILTGVKEFTVDYFLLPTMQTPMNSGGSPPRTLYTDNSVPADAKTINIKITTESGSNVHTVTSTSTLRITRVNGA